MWGRRSIRFDLARLVHAEARRARRFGGLGPRVLRATACNPSFVSRDRHSLASPLREGGRDDSIASGSVCSVGHRIEPDFITRGFRVFGVFRGFTGLDFPGWACRLEFGAERAAPSGARGVDGVSGSTWPDWFTRRRGERGGLAGLVPASSAPPRATLLSFHGTATRWPRSYGMAGVTTRFRPVPCVPWATGLSLISLPGAFVYLVCFVVLPVWTFRAGLPLGVRS